MRDLPAPVFRDRADAGRALVRHLRELDVRDPVVLGLPRGGVVVAYEVARGLEAPLDVVVARKVGAPHQPEYAIGAVAPGVSFLREDAIRDLELTPDAVERQVQAAKRELDAYVRRFREGLPQEPLVGRTAIVVDDGLATGATAAAAVRSVREQEPDRVVLAVPVCAIDTARWLRAEVEVLCVVESRDFAAVGLWYERFEQVDDADVVELLRRARAEQDARTGASS